MANLHALHEQAKKLSRKEWEDIWIRFGKGEPVELNLPALPTEDIQQITNNLTGERTMRGAATFHLIVADELEKRFPQNGDLKLLDYGAGWGRITRLYLRSIRPDNLFAVDVDDRLVAAGQELLGTNFSKIESGEPLPFPDAMFDAVVSKSVFSHLSETVHLHYVSEIARILKPGGLFIGTVLTMKHLRSFLSREGARNWIIRLLGDDAEKRVSNGEFVYGESGRWKDYGIAIVPDDWLQANWGPWFDIVDERHEAGQMSPIAIRK